MTTEANLQLNISWGNLYRTTHYNVCYNTLQNPQLTYVSEHDFNISRLLLPQVRTTQHNGYSKVNNCTPNTSISRTLLLSHRRHLVNSS